MNDNEVIERGWSQKGVRLYGLKKGKKSKRVSIISGLMKGKLCAPFLLEGSCCRKVFELYLSEILIPTLPHGKTIILDNASFHKGGNIENIVRKAGCQILYLPPYSPDFNPIEHKWFPLKHDARKHMEFKKKGIYEALEFAITNCNH